ncbi:hypothetical protein EDB85DRAFT_1895794 [Lactarius pseudohatsudake]|nr:hypothetical protein EDB85DRAFT_1895794 [Lactarius pseudohatsudake]
MPTADPPRTPTTSGPLHTPGPTSPKSPSSIALANIESNIVKILKSVNAFEREFPNQKEAVISIFHKFIRETGKHRPHFLPPTHAPKPNQLSDEISDVKEALKVLQKSVESLWNHDTPTPPANTPCKTTAARATETSKPTAISPTSPAIPSNTQNITLKPPPCPSIIVHTATKEPANRPPPHVLCDTINKTIKRTSHSHAHISSAKWTANGNIVLTGGHADTLQQLLAAEVPIADAITSNFPAACKYHDHKAPHITANVKWSKPWPLDL